MEENLEVNADADIVIPATTKSESVSNTWSTSDVKVMVVRSPSKAPSNVPVAELLTCATVSNPPDDVKSVLVIVNVQVVLALFWDTSTPALSVISVLAITYVNVLYPFV